MTTSRTVATFPLNGVPDSGYHVMILDEDTDREQYVIQDRSWGMTSGSYRTIGDAVARCLSSAGWGTHRIKAVANV